MQVFPESLRKLWNEWELRVLVLLSLYLQIVLIIFGNKRKSKARIWVRILVWLTYLSADWVATVALGTLSNSEGDYSKDNSLDPNYVINAFWAPFLLLHLGGPDTITAYSLEDNELWLRHLLGLVVQVGVAFYVFIMSWTGTHLTLVAIPVFISGIIKYGERTWVLRSASSKYFRDTLLPPPDPGPDYAKFMEQYSLRIAQGLGAAYGGVIEPVCLWRVHPDIIPDAKLLHEAYFLFKMFRHLYADLILSFQERGDSSRIMMDRSSADAFKLVEIELGFMYDVLYTKATLVYSLLGTFLRSTSFLSSISAFMIFWVIIDKHAYSNTDITITYLLLVGAIVLDTYAVILLIFSDWTMLWLTKHKKPLPNFIYRVIASSRLVLTNDSRWSGSMAQYNLIGLCLKDKPARNEGVQKFFGIYEMLEIYRYGTWEDVTTDLEDLIYQQLRISGNALLTRRGGCTLERKRSLDRIGWSVIEVEFDQSILLWHIATDLCYYSDLNTYQDWDIDSKCKISKSLSDYMVYLLVMCPFMLPNGIGQIRYRDTCAEAMKFFQERRNFITSRREACMALLQVNTDIAPRTIKGDRSKSVLFDGSILAKSLQSLEREELWDNEQKWEMISHVWVEMLSYAASQCGWNNHGRQLRRGGELLTHVSLLMAHLGISNQFQISAGHARMTLD